MSAPPACACTHSIDRHGWSGCFAGIDVPETSGVCSCTRKPSDILTDALAAEGERVLLEAAVRPYAPGTPLVTVSESAWEEACEAESVVPDLQDALANANAYVERLPDKIADYLLTHVGGDESQPWQAGHNYAMTEAARLVRERYYALDEDEGGTA